MNPVPPVLEPRDADGFEQDLLERAPGFVPEWSTTPSGPGKAIARAVSVYLLTIAERLNLVPEKNKLAFLDTIGVRPRLAQSARVPIVFELPDKSPDAHLQQGFGLQVSPPPGSNRPVVFETERSLGVSAAKLRQVVSLWPGSDEWFDHSDALLAKAPLRLFARDLLQATPHEIYLGDDTLLALSQHSEVSVRFELTTPSSELLETTWEYWDGAVWREFANVRADCGGAVANYDSTDGLRRLSGRFLLVSDCAESAKRTLNGVTSFWIRGRLTNTLPVDPARILPEVRQIRVGTTITSVNDIPPDKAFAGATALDVTKTFYPFGPQPQQGMAFYLSSEEAFGKPGAVVTITMVRADTPEYAAAKGAITSNPLPAPQLEWDYWNGTSWQDLNPDTPIPDLNMPPNDVESLTFTVQADMAKTRVNGQDGFWIRARLVSGGYGYLQTVQLPDKSTPPQMVIPVIVPPALSQCTIQYGLTTQWQPVQHVLTYNDFQYQDVTGIARWGTEHFKPFLPVDDRTPAVYLGFSQRLPYDQVGLLFQILEQAADEGGPALVWEYWDGASWEEIQVADGTRALRQTGIVYFIGPDDATSYARFDVALFWIRARLKEDAPPDTITAEAIYPHAVGAIQQQTIEREPLGTSTGEADQVFALRQFPVLDGERIEVRERAGLRADVEWKGVVLDAVAGDRAQRDKLEAAVATSPVSSEIAQGDVRLLIDRQRRVTEVWVRWQWQPDLFLSGPKDRHYALERVTGRIHFGDGTTGAIPPLGAAIMARRYVSGGGTSGNVPAQAKLQPIGAVGGLSKAFNPLAAGGGSDGETLASLARRGPNTIPPRGRVLMPSDYEALAYEANSTVARACAIPCLDAEGRSAPGWVTLVILPVGDEARPAPTAGSRAEVTAYLAARACATLAAAVRINVTGPTYAAVDVETTVLPRPSADAGEVERAVLDALQRFLHPVRGGLDARGWNPGEAIHLSHVASVIEAVAGVDAALETRLLNQGSIQGERVAVPRHAIVAAGDVRVKVLEVA